MIVIILNGICCTFITLRQSGALDKYFEKIKDDEEDGGLYTADDHDLSYEVDDDFADDAGDENAVGNDQISFSDLVKMRSQSEDFRAVNNNKDDEKTRQKLRICVQSMDDIKFNKLAVLNSPFAE